jgi:hypothetical protein
MPCTFVVNGQILPLTYLSSCTCLVKGERFIFNCLLVFDAYLTENTVSIVETNGVNVRSCSCELSVIFVGF